MASLPHRSVHVDIERVRLAICRPEVASFLFKSRVETSEVDLVAQRIFSRLAVSPRSTRVISQIEDLGWERAESWVQQCWINTITEIVVTNPQMEQIFGRNGGYAPRDPATMALYQQKFAEHFRYSAWIVGWGGAVGDMSNCFTVRLLSLKAVIRIEDVQAKRNGASGGWGLLRATIDGVRETAAANGQKVKAMSTSDRVEKIFRAHGFVDEKVKAAAWRGLNSKPLELN